MFFRGSGSSVRLTVLRPLFLNGRYFVYRTNPVLDSTRPYSPLLSRTSQDVRSEDSLSSSTGSHSFPRCFDGDMRLSVFCGIPSHCVHLYDFSRSTQPSLSVTIHGPQGIRWVNLGSTGVFGWGSQVVLRPVVGVWGQIVDSRNPSPPLLRSLENTMLSTVSVPDVRGPGRGYL